MCDRQWKPIETAPKDRSILVSDGGGITTVYWLHLSKYPGYWHLCETGAYADDGEYAPAFFWMELPELPKGSF